MLKSKIKTHTLGQTYHQPHFFILNKGNNAGKPAPAHWANCFVFLADDQQEHDFYYSVVQAMAELHLFRSAVIGTVVPFVRLGDVVDLIEETVNAVNTGERQWANVQNTVLQINSHQLRLQKQLGLLIQLRRSLFGAALGK